MAKEKQQKAYHYQACGLPNIYLVGGVSFLDTPRGKAVVIEDVEGLHRAIARRLVDEKKNLTGREFRFLRHEIGLTQQQLALLLHTEVQNVGRWERERGDKVPGPAQGLIRLLYNEKINRNVAISDPLARRAELDEDDEADIRFAAGPEGWSTTA